MSQSSIWNSPNNVYYSFLYPFSIAASSFNLVNVYMHMHSIISEEVCMLNTGILHILQYAM